MDWRWYMKWIGWSMLVWVVLVAVVVLVVPPDMTMPFEYEMTVVRLGD